MYRRKQMLVFGFSSGWMERPFIQTALSRVSKKVEITDLLRFELRHGQTDGQVGDGRILEPGLEWPLLYY